jgi:Amt family ammonium transporter
LAVGIFASDGKDITFWGQLKGVLVVAVFAFVVSYTVIFLINKFMPFRADDDDQQQGLDFIECGLESYPEFVRN